jgi:uncharacterized protein
MQLNPITTNEREHFMDALRGFAILGIFIANLAGFALYDSKNPGTGMWFVPSFDRQMEFAHAWFIEGKFYSMFGLLFGWGMALQWAKLKDKGITSLSFFRRRLSFMFLLGLMHLILLYPGDIVAFYALLGFVLLVFVNMSPRKLLIIGCMLILSPVILYYLKMQWPVIDKPSEWLILMGRKTNNVISDIHSREEFMRTLREGSWLHLIRLNISGFFFRFSDLFFQSRISKVLGMFLFGFALGKAGYFKVLMNNPKQLWKVVGVCLVIGLPCNFLLAQFVENRENYYSLKMEGWYQTIVYALGVAPLGLSYIAVLALAFCTTTGNKILMKITPVGKMAFTNYIMHSIIATSVFLGPGFRMAEKVGPVWWTIFAFIVFGFQILVSTIWLRYFQFGPIEWLWRSLTYWKKQPFRKEVPEVVPVQV